MDPQVVPSSSFVGVRLNVHTAVEGGEGCPKGGDGLVMAGDGVLVLPPVAHLVVAEVRRVSTQPTGQSRRIGDGSAMEGGSDLKIGEAKWLIVWYDGKPLPADDRVRGLCNAYCLVNMFT